MDIFLLVFGIILPWFLVGLGCWIGYQLIRQNGRILVRLEALEERLALPGAAPPPRPEGLRIGSTAPEFELPDLQGVSHKLSDWRGKSVVVAFFNPGCGFCQEMAGELASLPTRENGSPIPLIVTTGDKDENEQMVEESGITATVLLEEDGKTAERYRARGTPTGYLIDEKGHVASELAMGADAILALLSGASDGDGVGKPSGIATRSVRESSIPRDGLEAGTPAPEFTLPSLDGSELSLAGYRGRRVLLVFSDPDCDPCRDVAPELEELHRASSDPSILVVSRGDLEANRAKAEREKLTYPIVLQRRWEISKRYAMFATPVGYLIDEEGIIAADVASGAEQILALANGGRATSSDEKKRRKGRGRRKRAKR